MNTAWMVVLAALLPLWIACDNEHNMEFNPGAYEEVDKIALKGSSSTGGNPAIIYIGFDGGQVDGNRSFAGSYVEIRRVSLLTDSEANAISYEADAEDTRVSLGLERPVMIEFSAPSAKAFSALRLDEGGDGDYHEISVHIEHGGQVMDLDFPGAFTFALEEAETPWHATIYGYMVYMPVLEWMEEQSATPTLPVLLEMKSHTVLYRDENWNGLLDAEEMTAANVAGRLVQNPYSPTGDCVADCRFNRQPIPHLEIAGTPEALAGVPLDASGSCAFEGESDGSLKYFWDWAPEGKPAYAEDAVIYDPARSSLDDPASIAGSWTDLARPSLYLPMDGTYRVRVKVRDAASRESGPDAACPCCPEWAEATVVANTSEGFSVELSWDKGDSVDMDLFLVRHRDDGTFAISSAQWDALEPLRLPVPKSCQSSQDCDGFECNEQNVCEYACSSDAECRAAEPGWFCGTESGLCEVLGLGNKNYMVCEEGADCGGRGFCEPTVLPGLMATMICTAHEKTAHDDTCFFRNIAPHWGGLEPPTISCQGDAECRGDGDTSFTCGPDNTCRFECGGTGECLSFSERFVCEDGECLNDPEADDPQLTLDDVDGWGPERIELEAPAPGRYRVVARLYADPNEVLENHPTKSVRAGVNIAVNGRPLDAPDGLLTMEMSQPITYWKVADIEWGADGRGTVAPLCAGWTRSECDETADCRGYGEAWTCKARSFGRYCSSCSAAVGTPVCGPTIACETDADCENEGEASHCTAIEARYCHCDADSGYALDARPYSNPFMMTTSVGSSEMDPENETNARSIWCDGPEDTVNAETTCRELYQQ